MTNTKRTKPKKLKRIDNGFLIVWQDGHSSYYKLTYLRALCPCAECSTIRNDGQGCTFFFSSIGHGNIDKIDTVGIEAIDIKLVGRYAINFFGMMATAQVSTISNSYVPSVQLKAKEGIKDPVNVVLVDIIISFGIVFGSFLVNLVS